MYHTALDGYVTRDGFGSHKMPSCSPRYLVLLWSDGIIQNSSVMRVEGREVLVAAIRLPVVILVIFVAQYLFSVIRTNNEQCMIGRNLSGCHCTTFAQFHLTGAEVISRSDKQIERTIIKSSFTHVCPDHQIHRHTSVARTHENIWNPRRRFGLSLNPLIACNQLRAKYGWKHSDGVPTCSIDIPWIAAV